MKDPLKPDSSGSEISRSLDTQYPDGNPINWRISGRAPIWRPPTDFYETADTLVVKIEIAGMKEEDLTIELSNRVLSIRGVRQDTSERRAFHQMEIRYGEFSIDLELPVPVEASRVEATYQQGFLRIVLPKPGLRQIPIIQEEK